MKTELYLYAGYMAFWLIPTLYLRVILKKLSRISDQKSR